MITVGIDSGSQNTKAVALKDGQVLGCVMLPTLFDVAKAADDALARLLEETGLCREDIAAIISTGVGRGMVGFANGEVNEVIAAARGAHHLDPSCSFVIEMGAEASRAIRLNADGSVKTYTANDKCASGGGMFIETMARVLQTRTEDMGECALQHTKEIPINAQCVVFVESEVISLVHQNETKENIAYAVLTGISNRICSMARSLELTDGILFVGGPAKNAGLVACLEKTLGKPVTVPEQPDFVGALGAALQAAMLAESK